MSDFIKGTAIIVMIGLLLWLSPLLFIWCINVLFDSASIPYDFKHWGAALLLCLLFLGGGSSK